MPGYEDGLWNEDDDVVIDFTEGTIPTGPGSVEESATPHTEPHPVPEVEDEPLDFDPKVREDFEGLLYLGRLTDRFTWMGHTFVIRTLTTGEILEVGLLHKAYSQTLADAKAYQAALVAACVVSVDGKPLPMPLTNQKSDTELINKFEFVLRSWFPPTLDAIYERYLLLERKVNRVLAEMGKA